MDNYERELEATPVWLISLSEHSDVPIYTGILTAGRVMELDPHEIAWGLKEYGRCDTSDWLCVLDDR